MTVTAKIGLTGQYVLTQGGGAGPRPGVVTQVNANGTVDAREYTGNHAGTQMQFVQVGGTPPASDYFQVIDPTT